MSLLHRENSTQVAKRLCTTFKPRRKLLFVEGTEQSLDKPLYSLIFPNVTTIAKFGCHEVETAVVGIRSASEMHWVHAFGIIDNDGRTPTNMNELKLKGLYALSAFSVESIYYDPEIQRRVAERQVAVVGGDAITRLAEAKTAAISR